MSLTERQLEMRRTGIGASEAAVPAGYHPFMTAWDLWNAKVNGIVEAENNAMRAGSYLEPAVAKWYSDETGNAVHKCQTRRHRKHRWMLATADRQVVVDGKRGKLVEIKVPGRRGDRWGYDSDSVPPYVLFQAQQQMAVYEQEEVDVAALFLQTRELAIYSIKRNEELIQSLIEINGNWWRTYVVANEPPPMDGSSGASDWLRQRFGSPDQELVPATAEAEEWARSYASAQELIKSGELVKDLNGNLLRLEIGDHAGVVGPWGKVTWKPQRGRTNWKAVVEEVRCRLAGISAGDVVDLAIAKHTPPSIRVLRVSFKDALNSNDMED